ncbi:hypothetical protein RIF29_28167 [Crotalaria pallida]|uniref:Uncharacterized protein n=1 Tax=Crotalaria pallida TaxID=3830 RepID=A0AAN9ERH5_CROPI
MLHCTLVRTSHWFSSVNFITSVKFPFQSFIPLLHLQNTPVSPPNGIFVISPFNFLPHNIYTVLPIIQIQKKPLSFSFSLTELDLFDLIGLVEFGF